MSCRVQLGGLAALRRLYAWRTDVTPAGAEPLRTRLPKRAIDLGVPDRAPTSTDDPARLRRSVARD